MQMPCFKVAIPHQIPCSESQSTQMLYFSRLCDSKTDTQPVDKGTLTAIACEAKVLSVSISPLSEQSHFDEWLILEISASQTRCGG